MTNEPIITNIEQQDEPYRARLTPTEYHLTREKIEKINAKATKRGFTGRFELDAQRIEVEEKNSFGFPFTKVYYMCMITGEAPCYSGWRFLARLDAIPESDKFTLAYAPGVTDSKVDRTKVELGRCDHCHVNRVRKEVYVVENIESGEQVLVGSTCIKDFLGHDARFSWVSVPDVDLEEKFGGGYEIPTYTVRTILAMAYLCIKQWGWKKADEQPSTRSRVFLGLDPKEIERVCKDRYGHKTDEYYQYQEMFKALPEALERLDGMIEWAMSLDPEQSEFNANLRTSIESDEVTGRQVGLLCYVPEGYARHLGKQAEWVARQAQIDAERAGRAQSEFIGEIGERVTIEGTLSSVRFIEGQFGTTALYTILTDAGIVKWFASGALLSDEIGRSVKLKGTVKKHEVYRDTKSTVLTRCKELV